MDRQTTQKCQREIKCMSLAPDVKLHQNALKTTFRTNKYFFYYNRAPAAVSTAIMWSELYIVHALFPLTCFCVFRWHSSCQKGGDQK